MDIGNQQRVIIVEPIDIDDIVAPDWVTDQRSDVDGVRKVEAAEGPSVTPTLQTD